MMPVVVGKNADGDTISFDLSKLPHLLIGGAAGQGKTRFLHGLINGLITSCSPEEVRLILFDQSGAEFVAYENLPHLAVPVLNKGSRVALVLHWAVAEMEKRLKLLRGFRFEIFMSITIEKSRMTNCLWISRNAYLILSSSLMRLRRLCVGSDRRLFLISLVLRQRRERPASILSLRRSI